MENVVQPNPPSEATLRRYILGDLEETVRLAVEEQLVASPAAYDALALAEQALIDEYLDDALCATDRATFERRINAVTPLREKLRFAQRLRARATGVRSAREELAYDGSDLTASWISPMAAADALHSPAGSGDRAARRMAARMFRPAWAAALAAALVLLVGGIGWWAGGRARQGELEQLRAQHQQDRKDIDRLGATVGDLQARTAAVERDRADVLRRSEAVALRQSSAPEQSGGPGPAVVPTFVLATGVLRGAGSLPRVAVPEGAQLVRLRLPLGTSHAGEYRALLLDADGRERLTVSGLHAGGTPPAVTVTVAAEWLPRGDYELQLLEAGGEPPSSYPFRVTSR